MATVIVDGKDAIFGRIATVVAKELLKGNSVEVINCEQILVSGDKKLFTQKIKAKRDMGRGSSLKGPKYIRKSDRLVKRMIRGMLPWDRAKGRTAFKRLKCYEGQGSLKEEQLKGALVFQHNIPARHASIKEILRLLR